MRVYELSLLQKQIIYMMKYGDAIANITASILLNGICDKEKLKKTINLIKEKNEFLNIRLEKNAEGFKQYISTLSPSKTEINKFDNKKEFNIWVNRLAKSKIEVEGELFKIVGVSIGNNLFGIVIHIHHLIADARTVSLIANQFYEYYINNIDCIETSYSYLSYLDEEKLYIQSPRYIHDREFWLSKDEYFCQYSNISNKVTDNLLSSRKRLLLNKHDTNLIYEYCKKTEQSLLSIYATALSMYLNIINRNDKAIIGIALNTFKNVQLDKTIGMFINTVPLCIDIDWDSDFETNLYNVKKNILLAMRHQRYNYTCLLNDINRSSNFSIPSNLYDVYLSYQDIQAVSGKECDIDWYFCGEQTESLAISINNWNNSESIHIDYDYQIDKFSEEEIIYIHKHIIDIILLGIKDKNPITRNFISNDEEALIKYNFNSNSLKSIPDNSIKDLFERQVKSTPNNIAAVFKDEKISYLQLNHKVNQLSNILRKQGIQRGDYVAIISKHSIEMLIGILGIHKSGGVCVPIDTSSPIDRINYILNDCKPKIVLLYDFKIKTKIPTIDLQDCDKWIDNLDNTDYKIHLNDLFHIIYTSGTTGDPKGVMVENQNIISYVSTFIDYFKVSQKTVVLQQASIAFDTSVEEIYPALLSGGKVIILPDSYKLDINKMTNYINENKVTLISCSPLLLNEMNTFGEYPSIKTYISGGDVLIKSYISNLIKTGDIYNTYGPTEATVCATYYKLNNINNLTIVPIGKPITNVQVYIIGRTGLCGIGMRGELCIAGSGITRGYLGNIDLTNAKFSDNPYGNGKLYHTGDLAMWLPNGDIQYLGRIDQQVKIRGYRIELGEIETVIREIEGIQDVKVIIKENNFDKVICAYIVSNEKVVINNIRNLMRKKLPEYMIPSFFMQIENMPMTINGKIDVRALPKIKVKSEREYIAPQNPLEIKITDIFEEILKVTHIGVQDNFFEMGGHSLKAIKLINKIEEIYRIDFPLDVFFSNPTVIGVSKYLKKDKIDEYEPIHQAKKKDYYTASSIQNRLYVINQKNENSVLYNMPIAIELKGKINKLKIQEVFKILTIRHEVLRTSFHFVNGELMQKISDNVDINIEIIPANNNLSLEDQLLSFVQPFQLDKAPLFRIKLIEKSSENNILFFDIHHIIFDGVSSNILIKEFNLLYNNEHVDKLNIQYKDYSEWIKTRNIYNQKDYWMKQFSMNIPVVDLPTDYQRTKMQSFKGNIIKEQINNKIRNKIDDLCKSTGTTEYMVLLSAFMVLLSKYSRQTKIIVGTPVTGRVHKDLDGVLGAFVNTLALKGDVEENKYFKQFLIEIKTTCLEAYKNQEYSFGELVESINLNYDLSRNPLFDIVFSLEDDMFETINLNGISAKYIRINQYISKFDLTATASKNKKGYIISFEYCSSLFEKETIQNMLKHYKMLLEQISNNPNILISDISMCDKSEENIILNEFNDTTIVYPSNTTVTELFEEQVEKHLDNIAVICGSNKITYNELNNLSNYLAKQLRTLEIKPNDFIILISNHNIETIIGMCGIVKSGAAYVPVSPELPKEMIDSIINDCEPKAILSYENFESSVPNVILKNIRNNAYKAENLKIVSCENDIIYTIYTSGTTGKQKGVMVEHKNVIRLVKNTNYVDLDSDTVILQTGSMSFDASTFEVWGALLNGGKLILADNDTIINAKYLKQTIDMFNVNTLFITTALFNQMIADDKFVFHNLKYLMFGGEKAAEQYVSIMYKNNPLVKLSNMYGPTENTTFTTYYPIHQLESHKIPIGRPISNTKVYILNRLNLCGIGVPGEICIAGDGVARGYLNNSELTNEKFISNLFGTGRLYRSGDIGKWLPNGNIEYIGRLDEQVKIRGFRIEPAEIEYIVRNFDYIDEAVVQIRESVNREKSLYLYIVSNKEVNITHLRKEMKKKLPEYMVPSYIMQIDKIPLNKNGKINKSELPEIILKRGNEYIAPKDVIQEKICKIFEYILDVKPVGIEDDFFELGGHSLRATRLINKIEAELEVKLRLKDIFENSTVKALSLLVSKLDKNKYTPIPQADYKEYYPMSSAQKRIFLLSKISPNKLAYNIPILIRVNQTLEREKLENVINSLVARHEILRTGFYIKSDNLVQKIEENVKAKIEYINLSKIDDKEKIKSISNFIYPFNLSIPPLLRVVVGIIDEYSFMLLLDIHHIISDGFTMNILVNEFNKLYQGKTLESLPIQYKDYSEWVSKRDISKQKKYWINNFSEQISVLVLPYDFKRPKVKSFNGNTLSKKLDKDISIQISKLCSNLDVTEYMMFLSSFVILLYKYSKQEEIIVGTPVSGRTHKDTESMVGLFVNSLAIKTNIDENYKFSYLLKKIKNICLEAFENQDFPFEELIDEIGIKRDASRNPLFDVMFVYQNNEKTNLCLKDSVIDKIDINNSISKFDLLLDISPIDDCYQISLEYSTDLFTDKKINFMIENFITILIDIIKNPEILISDIEAINENEKKVVLQEFNNSKANYPNDKTIIDLFEEQVRKTPDNIAVSFNTEELTYIELNKKSNQLARKLRKLKVMPDDFIVLITERSIEMIIGIYGIIKAGAAYVPVDPEYPKERIDYIIKDCNPKAILVYNYNITTDIPTISLNDSKIWNEECSNIMKVNVPNNLLYVIYTSGTTGKPKGVMIEHKNIVRLLFNDHNKFDFNSEDVWLMFHSYCFDFSVWEMYGSMLNGGKLIVIPKVTAQDAYEVLKIIKANQVTILNQVPSAFYNLLDNDEYNMARIRYLIFGGEALNVQKLEKWYKKYPQAKIINMYGITETTVHVTYKEIKDKEIKAGVSNIGRPLPTLKVFIMNNMTLCGIGMPGELCVTGEGLSRGYLNNNDLTEKKFVYNPYDDSRLYRSGDLARWMINGDLEYLGRIDEQVKVRGFRIELGEIENTIRKIDTIKDVAVIAKENIYNEKEIYAYIISDKTLNPSEIKTKLQKKLPPYMMPSYIIQIDKIPITSNGKLDKKALSEVIIKDRTTYIPPSNKCEEDVQKAFEETLGIDSIGVEDNFFEIGGDSIKAIRLVSNMREKGYDLSVINIIQLQTIREISKVLEISNQNPKYNQEEVTGDTLLTPIQKTFFRWNFKNPSHFNHAMMLKVNGKVNQEAIEQTLKEITYHHDILRAIFPSGSQKILSIKDFKFPGLDIYDYADVNSLKNKIYDKCTEMQKSLNIDYGPLLRFALFKTQEGNHLFICIHHLLVDGVSWRILLEDLEKGYKQYSVGKEIVLPYKTASYKLWANYLKEYANTDELRNEIEYWDNISRRTKKVEKLGVMRNKNQELYELNVELDISLSDIIVHKSPMVFNTKLRNILLAVIGNSVSIWCGHKEISILLESHGRENIDKSIMIDRTVGWFTSLFPIILNIKDDFKENIKLTSNMLESIPNHGFGYSIITSFFEGKIEEAETDVTFNYWGNLDTEINGNSNFLPSDLPTGESYSYKNKISTGIQINGSILNKQLIFNVLFDGDKYNITESQRLCSIINNVFNKLAKFSFDYYDKGIIEASDVLRSKVLDMFKECDKLLCTNRIISEYLPTYQQKEFLKESSSCIACEKLVLDGNYKRYQIENAVNKVIREQSVLRTRLSDKGVMQEFEYDSYIKIPFIDISEIDINEDKIYREIESITSNLDVFTTNNILTKHIILRVNHSKYIIYLFMHHVICDLTSFEIWSERIKSYINNELIPVLDVMPYSSYINFRIERNKTQEQEYNKFIDSAKLIASQLSKNNELCYYHKKIKLIEVDPIVINDPLVISLKLLKLTYDFYNLTYNDIPFLLLHHGRNNKNNKMMGMFLDLIPIYFNKDIITSKDEIPASLRSKISRENAISFYTDVDILRAIEIAEFLPIINISTNFSTEVGEYVETHAADLWKHNLDGNRKYFGAGINIQLRIGKDYMYIISTLYKDTLTEVSNIINSEIIKCKH